MNFLNVFIVVELIAAILFIVICITSRECKIAKGTLLFIMGADLVTVGSKFLPAAMWKNISLVLIGAGGILMMVGGLFIIKGIRNKKGTSDN